MISKEILRWLGVVSSYYILLPFLVILFRWSTHDTIRRRVGWYVLFNLCFTVITFATARVINNTFIFYLASPIYIFFVYRVYDAMVTHDQLWRFVRWGILAYFVFVVVDMIWLENFRTDFSANLYPIEKSIIIFMAYYFLYQFSKRAGTDFSALWIGLAIGINALFSLVVILYTPYIGFRENIISYFIWAGLGSIISIVSYSLITYGLWIAKPRLSTKPTIVNRARSH
jgi:hypothetical protein